MTPFGIAFARRQIREKALLEWFPIRVFGVEHIYITQWVRCTYLFVSKICFSINEYFQRTKTYGILIQVLIRVSRYKV